MWYSRKIARVVGSTLPSETYALSGSIDLLSWIRLQWSWMNSPSNDWKQPEAALSKCAEAYAVVDCKSLYAFKRQPFLNAKNIVQCLKPSSLKIALRKESSLNGFMVQLNWLT